jgi:hypothetical protein
MPPAPVRERRQVVGRCIKLERDNSALECAGMDRENQMRAWASGRRIDQRFPVRHGFP